VARLTAAQISARSSLAATFSSWEMKVIDMMGNDTCVVDEQSALREASPKNI
jgi:hypothetical protein